MTKGMFNECFHRPIGVAMLFTPNPNADDYFDIVHPRFTSSLAGKYFVLNNPINSSDVLHYQLGTKRRFIC